MVRNRHSAGTNRGLATVVFALALTLSLAACGASDSQTGALDAGPDRMEVTAAIRQQIDTYLEALDAGDVALASRVWRTSGDVSFIHPAGHARGWDEIQEFYGFFATAFTERELTVRDVAIHVEGDMAWAEFYWHFTATQAADGVTVETDGRESQVYHRADDRWELVHVHYSGPAMTFE